MSSSNPKSPQIVSALEVEGDKITLSFRGSGNKRYMYQMRIVGSLVINDDLTAVVANSISGLVPLVLGREVSGWRELVKELSGDSAGIVQKHLEETVALFLEKYESEIDPMTEGLLFTDGVFVTVQTGVAREHFSLADDHLPSVQDFELSSDQRGIRVSLKLPDGRSLEFNITGAENVISAERAITLLRRRRSDPGSAAIEFKVPSQARLDQSLESARHDKMAAVDFRTASGEAATYDAAVALVYPYLAGTVRIGNASREKAEEVSGAAFYLVLHSKIVRGPSFESLRSLSISRNRQMMNAPSDSLAAKLVGRVLAGKGDDDSSVLSMIEIEVRQLQVDATMRYVQVVLDSDPLTDQRVRDNVSRLFISDILGRRPPASIREEDLSSALEAYKASIKKTLTSPGVVGNVMASRGSFDLATMRKADKRNSKGRFTSADLEMIATVAASYRGVFKVAARLQRAMGWQPSEWDPVDFVVSLGHGR